MPDDELRPLVELVIGENFDVPRIASEQFKRPELYISLVLFPGKLIIRANDQDAFRVDGPLIN